MTNRRTLRINGVDYQLNIVVSLAAFEPSPLREAKWQILSGRS